MSGTNNLAKIEIIQIFTIFVRSAPVDILTKMVKICFIPICAKKYFLSKLFVPLIKGSVSQKFKAIFGKLNF